MAAIRQAEGDLDGALELLAEAERLYVGDFSPDVRPVAALKARVWIAQGRLAEASDWARERGLSRRRRAQLRPRVRAHHPGQAAAGPGDAGPFRAARLVRRPSSWSACWRRRRRRAERERHRDPGRCRRSPVSAGDDVPGALASLERAIALAEPEGYVRVFVDEGPPMAALLKLAAKQPSAPGYVRRLLAAVVDGRATGARRPAADRAAQRTGARGPAPPGERSRRPGHRARAHGVPGHRADAHQEHLRQARREQPAGSRPPGRRARPALAHRGTADPPRSPSLRRGPEPAASERALPGRAGLGDESSPRSSRVVMRAHHIRLHGVSSDSGRCCRPEIRAGNTHEERDDRTTPLDTRSPRGRTLRDPARGAPRRALGRLVRRTRRQPRGRRDHGHQRSGRRPGSAPRAAPARA